MDPDEALRKAREASKAYDAATTVEEADGYARDLAEHFDALDQWLSNGGFRPADWQRRAGS